ncbi:unnamed protein product [Cuscuta epithymum]|uniref:Uncharacterized protein n=1 Tax=Cuscuta epithymum TaxID=186058 RepID=A0AAV0CWS9_9ASTE|nr:unnamed protein product [Cuscuta epithymum]
MLTMMLRIVHHHLRESSARTAFHFHSTSFSSSSSRTLKSIPDNAEKISFVTSYLISKFGLSSERAISASKHMNFKTPEKPDSVLTFLKNHGFTDDQILKAVIKLPTLLVSDPEKTLFPKIEFCLSLGFSQDRVASILSGSPSLFKYSLENSIVPSLNFLRTLIPVEEALMTALKSCTGLLTRDLKRNCGPNIQLLREIGVPESNIVYLFKYQPKVFLFDKDKFRDIVEKVRDLGVDTKHVSFVIVIKAMRICKLIWEKKMMIYKNSGISENEVLEAFKKYPWLMMVSQEKLVKLLDFLVNQMGLESSILVRRPQLTSFSLERRTIPRCLVYRALLAKGLVREDCNVLLCILTATENTFLKKFVKCHGEHAPELLEVYQSPQQVALSLLPSKFV